MKSIKRLFSNALNAYEQGISYLNVLHLVALWSALLSNSMAIAIFLLSGILLSHYRVFFMHKALCMQEKACTMWHSI